jgi:hypothetical protein
VRGGWELRGEEIGEGREEKFSVKEKMLGID